MNQLPALFSSPFNGDFDYSANAILQCLGIKRIEDEPVVSAAITYRLGEDIIEAGPGKYYGLAFLYYCLQEHGTPAEKESGLFKVTFPMAVEAILYYGAALWSDDTRSHPAIAPFRVAAQNISDILIQLKYEPHH